MKIFQKIASVALIMLGSVGVSWASSSVSLDSPPTSIRIAQQNGIELLEHFKTETGLDGWLVKNKTGYNIWFSDESGYVFVGAYLDPAGNNLTAKYLDEKAPKIDYKPILDRVTYVSTHPNNPSERPVYVFYEPHCGFCSAFHAAAEPYINMGAEVRWIPVAFLKPKSQPGTPSSYELVAKIMNSSDPNAIISAHERSKALTGGRSGLAEGDEPTPEIFAMTEKNSRVMNELGFTGTPAVVFTDENGDIQLIKGFPKMAQLPDVFGMPRMDSTDGRLGRFGSNPAAYPVK